ncbi:MAG: hypothetical protein LC792_07305 [Actinobacteria bacterium]|nr:hypothetical protein [Actinomycetota bacterium]
MATTDGLRGVWASPTLGKRRLADWVDQWWATTTDLAPTTRARDERILRRHILTTFGTTALAEIGQLEVKSWVADLSASGLAPNTVQQGLPGPLQGAGRRRRCRVAGRDAVPKRAAAQGAAPGDALPLPRRAR